MRAELMELATSSRAAIQGAETATLLELYNALTGKETKKFASREKGITQTLEAIANARTEGKLPEVEKTVELKDGTTERKFRIKLPFTGATREPKANSKRAGLLKRLLDGKGLTIEQAMEDFDWARKDAYEGIRLIHVACGYGIDQFPDGRIFAHMDPPGKHKSPE